MRRGLTPAGPVRRRLRRGGLAGGGTGELGGGAGGKGGRRLSGPGLIRGRGGGVRGRVRPRIPGDRGHGLRGLAGRRLRDGPGPSRAGPGRVQPAGPAQRDGELGAGGVPVCGDLGQGLGHDLVHGRGQVGAAAGQRGRRGGDLGPHDRDRLVPDERWLAGEHGVCGAGQRVLVSAPIYRPGFDLLGRDVVQGAQELAGRGQRADGQGPLAQPEVGEVRVAGVVSPARGIQQDVARLDVPVDQAVRMRRLQGRGDLGDDVTGPRRGHRPRRLDEGLHVRPLHEAHRDEQHPVGLAGLEDRDDVGMVDRGRGARFPDEPLPERLVPGQFGRQHLDRDLALQPGVVGAVDHGHATPADLLVQPVPGQAGSDAGPAKCRGLVSHRGPLPTRAEAQAPGVPLVTVITWGTLLSLDPWFPLIRPAERRQGLR